MSEKNEEITPELQLLAFRNGHLKDFIAAKIRLGQAEQADPEETVGFQERPAHGGGVVRVEVKAKDVIKNEKENIKHQSRFLIAIEKLEQEFKKNKTPWRA